MRTHRSIAKRARKVDPNQIADQAEYYRESLKVYKPVLRGVTGLLSDVRVKGAIKRIDDLEKEMLKLEDKLEALAEKRAFEAAKLEADLMDSYSVVEAYLTKEEFKDFRG